MVTGFLAADEDDVLLINDAGVLIRTGVGSISVQGRAATGVRVMNLDGETKVAAVARVLSSEDGSDEDEDPTGPVDADGADDAAGTTGDGADAAASDDEPGLSPGPVGPANGARSRCSCWRWSCWR